MPRLQSLLSCSALLSPHQRDFARLCGLPKDETMDPAKWTPSLNQRDELDRAMKTANVLREWAALKKQGIIDDAEFQAMKARLLGRPPPPVEQVSDDEEKIGWSVNNDDEDAQRWASRNVAFAPKRPLLQPLEQRLLRTTPIKKRPAHSTGVMSRPATASQIPPPASPEEWDARRPHTRGELQEREFLSIGYASPPARSMDDVPWNSSTNTWRRGSSCPSKVRRPWQEADGEEAVAPPRRPRRRPRRRVVRLAPPPGIRPASAPKPWGHHRLVGGFFPPAPLEGRHGVSPGALAKFRG